MLKRFFKDESGQIKGVFENSSKELEKVTTAATPAP